MIGDSGLAGKTVIVTGGSRGIGRSIVELFAADGADVVFFYRSDSIAATAVVEAGRAQGHRIAAEQVDVTDAAACEAAVERTIGRCGSVDVLVNNAGMTRDNLLALLEVEDVRIVLDTNVGGVFNVTRGGRAPHDRPPRRENSQHEFGRRRQGRARPDQLRRQQGGDQRHDAGAGGELRHAGASR